MELLQDKVMHPMSILMQLPEGCKDYFIKAESRKSFHTAKWNTDQQQLHVEPVTWTPRIRQGELDDLRLEQETAQSRSRKEPWTEL